MVSETVIDLEDLRIKIDQINEKLISGLKNRSRIPLNKKIFEEKFFNNLTWFEYRLKKEQDLDSEFGRFLYYDQQPFLFSKKELSKPKIGEVNPLGLEPVEMDFSKKIFSLYKKTIFELCENKEDRSAFGEATKQDVENILTLNERTVGIGQQVAAFKLGKDPLLKKKCPKMIRKNLVKPKREKEVIKSMKNIAKKYGVGNSDLIEKFARQIIEITLDAEVYFIKKHE